jgi:hypothetical protein
VTAATPGHAAHQAETVAIAFHQAYEELAPQYGYRTREASAKPWDEVPEQNAALMVATAARLLETGVISAAQEPHPDAPEPLIVSEDPVLNGPRLSWYASMSKAEFHHDTLTASRDGVLPDGNTYLHQIPSSWLSAAVRAYGLLREGKAGEALAVATHERLDGRIVEVAR